MRFMFPTKKHAGTPTARASWVTVTLLLGWLLAGNVSAQSLPDRVEKPDFKVGDYWIFNKIDGNNGKLLDVTSETVTKIDASGYRLTGTEGAGAFVNTTLRNSQFNLIRTDGGQGYPKAYVHTSKPFYPHFAFPLTKGKGWTQKVELTWSSHPSVLITFDSLEAKVIGWEMVTVPAGNFQALKIELSGWNNGNNGIDRWSGHVKETLWFSPLVRNVVRTEYVEKISASLYRHDITELQGYGLTP